MITARHITDKSITAKEFVRKEICPYAERYCHDGSLIISRIPDSDLLQYAALKLETQMSEFDLSFIDSELYKIMSDDKEKIQDAVESIHKKFINYFSDYLREDFNNEYDEYLHDYEADECNRTADDAYDSMEYPHAA